MERPCLVRGVVSVPPTARATRRAPSPSVASISADSTDRPSPASWLRPVPYPRRPASTRSTSEDVAGARVREPIGRVVDQVDLPPGLDDVLDRRSARMRGCRAGCRADQGAPLRDSSTGWVGVSATAVRWLTWTAAGLAAVRTPALAVRPGTVEDPRQGRRRPRGVPPTPDASPVTAGVDDPGGIAPRLPCPGGLCRIETGCRRRVAQALSVDAFGRTATGRLGSTSGRRPPTAAGQRHDRPRRPGVAAGPAT
jgi:hypothetical protein